MAHSIPHPSTDPAHAPLGHNDPPADQTDVVQFLSEPMSYGRGVARVEILETHGAFVFLAGDQAYKLKRSVKLPYLDFSTPELRLAALSHEFDRNQPFAPNIYRRIVPVTHDPYFGFKLGGDGYPVDWVLMMERFHQDCLLDRMALDGRLDVEIMSGLAAAIADMHMRAPIRRNSGDCSGDSSGDWAQKVATQVFNALTSRADSAQSSRVNDLGLFVFHELDRHRALLDHRARRGAVRLCHGDLHLRNIVLLDGKPTLFDAIEFDDKLATIDVLYDLAFTLMDLMHRRLPRQANELLNSYAARAMVVDDLAGLALLPLFLSLRAAVRAMVTLDQPDTGDTHNACAQRSDTAEYLKLALSLFVYRPSTPCILAVGGRSGTGKTTIARQLAPDIGCAPGALHLRSDVERKTMLGVGPCEKLELAGYTCEHTTAVYKRLAERAEAAIRAGHSVVIDATCLAPEQRELFEALATKLDVPFHGIWLRAPEATLVERVTARKNDASDADAAVVHQQLDNDMPGPNWSIVSSAGRLGETVERVRLALAQTNTLKPRPH